MDVNLNAEVKGFGLPVSPAIVREDRNRPPVSPVANGAESGKAKLDDQARRGHEKKPSKAMSAEETAELVKEMQQRLDSIGNTRLQFSLHKEPETVVVQISDRKSGEVIRQFPAEASLVLRQKLEELVGLLFDEKA